MKIPAWAAQHAHFITSPLIKRMRVTALDSRFFGHRKIDGKINRAEFLDSTISSELLATKIASWDADDHKAFVTIFFPESLQSIILGGKAASGCRVNNK